MLINRVARTNITFYGIISIINIFGLIALAIWGESFFSVTHDQFLQLRSCLYIIALFCVLSWGTTTFNQLLVAHMQMAYTMQIQSVMALLKGLLIAIALLFSLTFLQLKQLLKMFYQSLQNQLRMLNLILLMFLNNILVL